MNSKLKNLKPYPFERLNHLIGKVVPPSQLKSINFSVGEPKHSPPKFVMDVLKDSLSAMSYYPKIHGSENLRVSIKNWLAKRYTLDPESLDILNNIAVVSGTREGIFSFVQAIIEPKTVSSSPIVITENPTYQIYEGAAIMAGAEVIHINNNGTENSIANLKSLSSEILGRCQILFLCSPSNPSGNILSKTDYEEAIKLADKYKFILASDECYSEIYLDESKPPCGLLQVCSEMGRTDYKRCVAFHSLSKRSNLPGMRSGFVAGDKDLMRDYKRYRTYHGASIPSPIQDASAAAWSDEYHCVENRSKYREKFKTVESILSECLSYPKPEASFYLWPKTPINSETFAYELFKQKNVTVLPGHFMSSDKEDHIYGYDRIRMALVPDINDCIDGAIRIREFIKENHFIC